MIDPEAEQAGRGLGTEPRPRQEPGGVRSEPELTRLRTQPEGGDQLRVELPDGDGAIGLDVRHLHAERGEDGGELDRREMVVRAKVGDARRHQTGVDDLLDLRRCPRARRWRRLRAGAARDGDEGKNGQEGCAPHLYGVSAQPNEVKTLLRNPERCRAGDRRGYAVPVRGLSLLLALGALVVAGCGGGSGNESAAPVYTTTEAAAPESSRRVRRRRRSREPLSTASWTTLAELRGRQVFVNVWSSW